MPKFMKQNGDEDDRHPNQGADQTFAIEIADERSKDPKGGINANGDPSSKLQHHLFPFIAFAMVSPINAGDSATTTPAALRAAILLFASPFPPEIIAPA